MGLYTRIPSAVLTALLDAVLSPVVFPRRHLTLLEKVDMPELHKAAARASFARAAELDKQVQSYKLRAPFVLVRVLRKLPREAEVLPENYWQYDNEISINGDQHPEAYDASVGRFVKIPAPLADTAENRAACYYAPGCDPRGAEARYVWLADRNRASKLAFNLGPETDRVDVEHWGDAATGKGHPGVVVRRMGDHYEIYGLQKLGPLCVRTRYGFKIANAVSAKGKQEAAEVLISNFKLA